METYKNIAAEIVKNASVLFAEREKVQTACEVAKQKFESAQSSYDDALRKYDANHRISIMANADKAKAQADFEVARAELHDFEVSMPDKTDKLISDGREAVRKAMDKRAKPVEIERDALELLKSGVLTLDEYAEMLDGYSKGGNEAMKRITLAYAVAARDEAAKRGSTNSNDASYCRLTATIAACGDGEAKRQFEALFDCISRTGRNRALIPIFESSAASVVSAL